MWYNIVRGSSLPLPLPRVVYHQDINFVSRVLTLRQMFFFGRRKVLALFFRPIGATVRTFGIVFFFLTGASQNAPSGHDPYNFVSSLENLPFHERNASDYGVSS